MASYRTPCGLFLLKGLPLISDSRLKSENSACDSITYINGTDSDLRKTLIKSYNSGIAGLKMDFLHSQDAYYQFQISKRNLV